MNKTNINVPKAYLNLILLIKYTSPHKSAIIHSIFVLFILGDVTTPKIK